MPLNAGRQAVNINLTSQHDQRRGRGVPDWDAVSSRMVSLAGASRTSPGPAVLHRS
jgi:hypothetical protein